MSSQYIGIEEARGRLGDLVTAAQQGIDTILTRNRRPVARITHVTEDTMPITALIAPLSEGTLAAVANVVEYTIEREYDGTGDAAAMTGARILALAGVQMDVVRSYLDRNGGDDRYLPAYADSVLRQAVTEGLAARRCQCPEMSPSGPGHSHVGRCASHYEADVPELGGLLLCGGCHVARYEPSVG